jgi:hypothetical protein
MLKIGIKRLKVPDDVTVEFVKSSLCDHEAIEIWIRLHRLQTVGVNGKAIPVTGRDGP